MDNVKEYLNQWSSSYKEDLLTNIMPFWMQFGWDRKHGGVYTCVNRDGSLMDTTKSVWFQGRFAFVCSFAYNTIEKNPEWLEAAKSTLDFIEKYCIDTDGHMFFEVTENGEPSVNAGMCFQNRLLLSPWQNMHRQQVIKPMQKKP